MKKTLLTGLATGLFMLGMVGVANATFYGTLYDGVATNQSTADSYLTPGNMGTFAYAGIATFTVETINFNAFGSQTPVITYGQFLAGNGLIWTSNATIATQFMTTSATQAAFFQLTGTGYFAADAAITHDDGIYMVLTNGSDSKIYDSSVAASTFTHTLSGLNPLFTAGTYDFVLNYSAWNGNPENLVVNGLAPVPEPATMLLFGAGIAGLAAVARRKRS